MKKSERQSKKDGNNGENTVLNEIGKEEKKVYLTVLGREGGFSETRGEQKVSGCNANARTNKVLFFCNSDVILVKLSGGEE